MRTRLWALAASGLLVIALTGCMPCSLPLGFARRGAVDAPTVARPTIVPDTAGNVPLVMNPEQVVIDVYKRANPAVVNVRVTKHSEGSLRFQPQEGEPPDEYVRGQGSGFVIDSEGHIVTNHHVVEGAEEVLVVFSDGDQARATLVGLDPDSDLAVIKVDPPLPDLTPLELGDSDLVQVGQMAFAIGNPFGLQGTLTTGIVSSVGRTLPLGRQSTAVGGRFSIPRMVQTDAAINPGNSGGPLLDSHGNVIGINTAIYGPQGNIGIGFAMPVNRAKAMLEDVQSRGRFQRPDLGIRAFFISGDLAEALNLPPEGGLLIQRVESGSPADNAGLRGPRQVVIVGNYRMGVGGDLIIAVDGHPIEDDRTLQRVMNRKRTGDTVELTIFRNGRTMKVRVPLGAAPETL